jgi:hypothetical protein
VISIKRRTERYVLKLGWEIHVASYRCNIPLHSNTGMRLSQQHQENAGPVECHATHQTDICLHEPELSIRIAKCKFYSHRDTMVILK